MIYAKFKAARDAIQFPDKKVIKAEVFDGMDQFVGTKAQLAAEEARREQLFKDLFSERINAYNSSVSSVTSEFAAELSKEYGTEVPDIDSKVYSYAWERGHSGGYSDVESVYMDLADIAQVAYEQGRRSYREESN